VLFNALIIALVIRTFLFQPFNIPSGSMIPTLLVGDYLFVSKYSYGYTHYSFPFSPRIFSGRVLGGTLKRGDVVVFRLPKDDSIDYIKRVIGLPGDKIQMIDGVLNINGEPVKRERIDDFVIDDDGVAQRVKRYKETLTNGVVYTTLDLTENGFYDNTSGASNAHGCAGRSSHWYKAQPAVYSSPGQWSYSLGSNGSIPNTPEWTYEICCTNT